MTQNTLVIRSFTVLLWAQCTGFCRLSIYMVMCVCVALWWNGAERKHLKWVNGRFALRTHNTQWINAVFLFNINNSELVGWRWRAAGTFIWNANIRGFKPYFILSRSSVRGWGGHLARPSCGMKRFVCATCNAALMNTNDCDLPDLNKVTMNESNSV